MKKMNNLLLNIIMFLALALPVQSMLAVDVPLKKGDPGDIGDNHVNSMLRTMSIATSINPVVVSLENNELFIDFSQSVGIAQISILDQNGFVVYQNAINTKSTQESVIETSGWDSGNYTVHISYGKTSLVGAFQL